jgi:hypothetical protein
MMAQPEHRVAMALAWAALMCTLSSWVGFLLGWEPVAWIGLTSASLVALSFNVALRE